MLNFCFDINKEFIKTTTFPTNQFIKISKFSALVFGNAEVNEKFFIERKQDNLNLILYTQGGEGIAEYNDKIYHLKPKSIFICSCEKKLKYYPKNDGKWQIKWLYFLENSNDYMIFFMDNLCPLIELPDNAFVNEMYTEIFQTTSLSDFDKCMQHSYILSKFFAILFTKLFSDTDKNQKLIDICIEYIDSNIKSKTTIKNLSDICHISSSQISRIFVKKLGVSPYEYIIRRRIELAKTYLLLKNYSIETIAAQCGFSSSSQFVMLFKKQTGTTPGKYA